MKAPVLAAFCLAAASLAPAQSALEPGSQSAGGSTTHALLVPSEVERYEIAVRTADAERIAAMRSADRARLEAILSDQLGYAHSNGTVDTKASLIDALVARRLVYQGFEYKTREFVVAAPGIVLMKGRVLVRVGHPPQAAPLDLNFLAVWREEAGHWRFLAWQSSRNVPPAPVPAAQ